MKLKHKVSILLLSGYLILLVAILVQRIVVAIPELKQLQATLDFHEVERVASIIDVGQVQSGIKIDKAGQTFKIYPMKDVGNTKMFISLVWLLGWMC